MTVARKITQVENELLQEVSKERLMRFTEEISREVRLSGTEEELRAFQYAKENLDSFGLKTELLFCDAYISLPGKASLTVGGETVPCITHAMAKPTEGLEATVVYVGKGASSDYESQAVLGRVVLIDGLAIPGAVKIAAEHGAVGAIFVNAKYTHEMIVSPVWGNPVPDTVGLLPRIPVVSVTVDAGERIKEKIAASDNLCKITAEVDTRYRPIPTLIAEIKGAEQPDKFVLFSGHIDSWHYGVMDNGTANAVMLEVARTLAQYQGKLKRTLRLAFWSEHSHGRYAGSAWYCDTYWEELTENCVLHINIDSVGAKGATVLTEANCMAETRDFAKEVIKVLTGDSFKGSRFGRAGDQSFWGTGTPSLFMGLSEQEPSDDPASKAFGQLFGAGKSGGFGWWWHTTEDTLDKIDPDNLERDCKIYLVIVYRFLTDPVIPVNPVAAVDDILEGLSGWQMKAGKHFDLTLTIERTEQLKAQVSRLAEQIGGTGEEDQEKAALINETLMELSRLLVPLNYVKESQFGHDLALKQPPIPKLAEIDRLIQLESDSNEYKILQTSLIRKHNEVNYTLKKANQLLAKMLG
ncbi:M28 family peptidase [Brevibacillus massiliensis]|uniref:M28 family peptidase n=1 Tax=Brevibacillus massiliensis TaxID=1118054 RepID=UPI0003087CBD|nr:M28 family peptidase [Brevibacillus massiliensis]